MNIPPAGIIEAAADALKEMDATKLADQRKELMEATNSTSAEFSDGYNLGLQTARLMLLTNPMLALHDVDAEKIL